LVLGAFLLGAGCSNPFIPKYKVLVDSIASPEAKKPAGQSYRLVIRPALANQTPIQVPVVAACVTSALGGVGLFEAPVGVPSDLVIELSFGTDASARVEAIARETYLQLSARTNPERSLEKSTGPEVWDVRVAVLGLNPGSSIESAMPLLSSVAVNYLASDTHVETEIDIPQNSPTIAAVREGALKTLEAKFPASASAAKASTQAPPPPPPVLPPPVK
jgi:hypothetical protein